MENSQESKAKKFLRFFFQLDDAGRTLADRHLSSMNLEQLGYLIDLERESERCSPTVLKRLHQRYCRIRADEERAAMLEAVGSEGGTLNEWRINIEKVV